MKDLSIENLDIKKETNQIALHSFFGAFSIFIISFIDGLFLSIKSEVDFSASIVSAPLIFLILSVFIGASNGLVVFMSKEQGLKISEKVKKTNGIMITMFTLSIIMIISFYFNLDFLIDKLGIPDELKEKSYNYTMWHYVGLPFCIYISLVGSKIKGLGNAKTLSKLMMSSALINVTLDPIFIFYYDLGAEGAAMSTTTSWIVVSTTYFLMNIKNKNDSFDFDFSLIINFSKLLPSFIVSQMLNILLGMITIYFINQYTLSAISAYGFTFRIEKLITILAFSFSSSIIMIGGQNLMNKERIIKTFNYSLRQTLLLNSIYVLILFFGIEQFALLCGFSPESARLSLLFIGILSVGYIFNSLSLTYAGYLYVLSKHNAVMYSNIIKVTVYLPLFVFIGNKYFGYEGIMYGVSISFILGLLTLILMTKKQFKELINQEDIPRLNKIKTNMLKKIR